eukprot:TRINITY_DN792_c0_g2_i1.p1 TRINITY_DN792_c0_g2~~TRINITY_DN792_c0_g2_i1.p1  ORF type:complete len:343 (-),score=108.04 TRINITY_DN792_c0_g2_i1:131-1159(-)
MQTANDCVQCLVTSTLKTCRKCKLSPQQTKAALHEVLCALSTCTEDGNPDALKGEFSPVCMFADVLRTIRKLSGTNDPYSEEKRKCNQIALELLPGLRKLVFGTQVATGGTGCDGTIATQQHTKLDVAIRASIAGNIIDLSLYELSSIDVGSVLNTVLTTPLAIDRSADLLHSLDWALDNDAPVLVIADNAGEIVFDRLMLEAFQNAARMRHNNNGNSLLRIWYAVKGGPAANDAMALDFEQAGFSAVPGVELVSTGGDSQGVPLSMVSAEMRDRIAHAGVIVSKGQANFETLEVTPTALGWGHHGMQHVFYLFLVKCQHVADVVGVKLGSAVVVKGPFVFD